MRCELPVYIEDFNMGAQYHNFLYSVLMTKLQNRIFFYQNYLSLAVKHMHQSHVDFAFDGIYTCERGPMQKLILRGPVQDLHQLIQQALTEGCYVIVNINEKHLPYRDAYHKYTFRHDLFLYGFDEEQKIYLTLGLDNQYHYRRQEYPYSTIESAYYHMQEEWDYELFLFRPNPEWMPDWSLHDIRDRVNEYLSGEVPGRETVRGFLEGKDVCQGFLNDSYYEYYGIRIYEYLEKRLKRFLSFLDNGKKEVDGAFGLGATDSRSIQVILAQKKILSDFLEDEEIWKDYKIEEMQELRKQLQQELEKIMNLVLSEKMLLMQVIFGGGKTEAKQALGVLRKMKQLDKEWMEKLLQLLEETKDENRAY